MAYIPLEWVKEHLGDWFGPTLTEPYLSPTGIQDRLMAEIDPAEIIFRMTQALNRQPITYTTDPETGRIIASRSMAKPPMPEGMPGRFYNYFGQPEGGIQYYPQEPEDLSVSAVLQPGWENLPNFRTYNPPTSAEQRAALYQAGISSEARPRFSYMEPAKDVASLLTAPTYTDPEAGQIPLLPAIYSTETKGWTTKKRPTYQSTARGLQHTGWTSGFIAPRSNYLSAIT